MLNKAFKRLRERLCECLRLHLKPPPPPFKNPLFMRVFGGWTPKKLFKIGIISPSLLGDLAVNFTTIIYILAKTIHVCQANFQDFLKIFLNFFKATAKPLKKSTQKNHYPLIGGVASQIFNKIFVFRRRNQVVR